jgi:hypothetical protein
MGLGLDEISGTLIRGSWASSPVKADLSGLSELKLSPQFLHSL